MWIDTVTFLRLKVQTIQTHLEGPIVSSEETTTYEPVPTGRGGFVLLPERLSTKQILLVAGRNLLLEKEQWFSDFRIDPPEFESERQAARASPHVMFRDTDAGVRYLVKRGAERVVSNEMTTSSKALAMGTTIDPSFAFPLPIVGINYLNFDVKGSGNQLALLFGGVFLLGNLQAPEAGKTPFDLSVDFFGIAVPGTDLRFDADGERVSERVLTIPMSTGVNIGYQFTPFQKLSAGYALRYDAYFHAPETAGRLRRSVQHGHARRQRGIRVQPPRLPDRRVRVGVRPSILDRVGTRRRPSKRRARRIDATPISGAKDFLFGPFQSVHVGAAWYGGAAPRPVQHVSVRAVRRGPDAWRPIGGHPIPRAGARCADRTRSTSWASIGSTCSSMYARGRDPNRANLWRSITGTGVAVTFKTPLEYDVHRRRRQELDPRPLSWDRIDRATVPPSQAVLTDS